MNRTVLCAMPALAACCALLHAQSAPPAPAPAPPPNLVAESKLAYTNIKTNLLKAADAMPEENYKFQPVPEIRTFAALVAHIADANVFFCSAVKGDHQTPGAASKTTKADLTAALKAGFDECDAAWDTVTDANISDSLHFGRGQSTRLGILIRNTGHDNEEYGYLAVYLRLKGVVPPSSAH